MGRMLDTLKHIEGQGRCPTEAIYPPSGTETNLGPEEEPDHYPYFIEVGGPGKTFEASPGVLPLAHPPQARVQPPHQTPGKPNPGRMESPAVPPRNLSEASMPLRMPQMTAIMAESKLMGVAFAQWPGECERPCGKKLPAELIVYHQPDHPISRQYANLLNQMLQGRGEGKSQSLMFTGMKPQVGATTVLLNLAVAAIQEGHKVVVLETQVAGQPLANLLGVEPGPGIQEVLAGTAALEKAVADSAIPSLHLLHAGRGSEDSFSCSQEAICWLLAWLRQRFDLILIDGPPMNGLEDHAILVRACDGIYLVRSQEESLSPTWIKTIPILKDRVRGVISTHIEDSGTR